LRRSDYSAPPQHRMRTPITGVGFRGAKGRILEKIVRLKSIGE
jgi:hypothetical protein